LVEFSIRRGSGGRGRFRGGDGLVREILLLSPMRVSILSDRRRRPPFGSGGGGPGERGKNTFAGREVPGRASVELAAGERVRIETPGGGGWGDGLLA
jgi:N-methylhydantoinase B